MNTLSYYCRGCYVLSQTLAAARFRAALHISESGIFLARLGASITYALRAKPERPRLERAAIDSMPDVTIVLPAYNEAGSLPVLLDRIHSALTTAGKSFEVIVVDDGSTDDTPLIAMQAGDRMPVTVITHRTNLGYGAGLRTGILRAAKSSKVVVTMDADDTQDPGLIPKMLDEIESGFDIVVASRMQPGGGELGVSLYRRLLSRGARGFLAMLAPIDRVKDYSSGYRAYRTSLIQRMVDQWGSREFLSEDGFVGGLELLLKARQLEARVTEVPLFLRYDRKKSDSQMQVGTVILDYFRVVPAQRRTRARLPADATTRRTARSRRHDRSAAIKDAVTIVLAVGASFGLTYAILGWAAPSVSLPPLTHHLLVAFVFSAVTVLVRWHGGHFRLRSMGHKIEVLEATTRAMGLAAMAMLALVFVVGVYNHPLLLASSLAVSFPLVLSAERLICLRSSKTQRRRGTGRRVVIIGRGETGRLLAKKLVQSTALGARVIGFIDDFPQIGSRVRYRLAADRSDFIDVPVLGRMDDIEAIVEMYRVDEVLIALPNLSVEGTRKLVRRCSRLGAEVGFVPSFGDERADQLKAENVGALPILRPVGPQEWSIRKHSKRLMDIIGAGVLIPVFAPTMLLCALAVRLGSSGPVLFKQERIGEGGRSFRILKFRTMRVEASPYASSPRVDTDSRISGVGRFLRATGLDEMPQLFNVLRGEMSLVGPRPEMPQIVGAYDDIKRRRLNAKPGITGLWQLSPDRAHEIHDNIEYDLFYIGRQNTVVDLLILGETALFALVATRRALMHLFAPVLRGRGKARDTADQPPLAASHPVGVQLGSGHVIVALDQRCRPSEPPSWIQFIPPAVALSQRWCVKLLVAGRNGRRFDEIANGSRAPVISSDLPSPEYIEYFGLDSVEAAMSPSAVVVTDLHHVASWAKDNGVSLVEIGTDGPSYQSGQAALSTEMLEELRSAFRARAS